MRSIPSGEVAGEVQPAQIGKYALLGAIGRGGMADVYLAIAHGPSGVRKLVVIKCMRSGSELDGTLSQMFLDEGRVAALLNHTNVVHTYEVGQGEDGSYIAMEYLHGQSLSALVRAAKPLAPRLSARIAADALSGLHYAHELRDLDGTPLHIVHRDLSPPNIFVTHDGVVKLVDFGIAKTAIATRASTEAGMVKGKLAYMAPEQTTSGVVDRRADIYAMGVVLWELLTGRRLVEDLSPASIVEHALHGVAPPVSRIRPEVDAALDPIVERALKRDPNARYATALEMRDALEEYLAQGPAAGGKELSRLMAQHFSAQREEREREIHAWVAAFTPEHPALEIATLRETPSPEPLVLQPTSGAFRAMPRFRRTPWLSRRRLVQAALIAGALWFGLSVFAFHEKQKQRRSSTHAAVAEPALAAAVVAPVTESATGPGVEPSSSIVAASPAKPASASRPSPSSARVARSAQGTTPRSHATPGYAGASSASASAVPARAAQPKFKGGTALESNPYIHSQ